MFNFGDKKAELGNRLDGETRRLRYTYKNQSSEDVPFSEINKACRELRANLIASMRTLIQDSAKLNEVAKREALDPFDVDATAYMILKATKVIVVENEMEGAKGTYVENHLAEKTLKALNDLEEDKARSR